MYIGRYKFALRNSNGQIHCDDGQPAIDTPIYKAWYKNGKKHRDDGPAEIIYRNGRITSKVWRRNGQLHNNKGAAIVRGNRYITWYKNGKKHREDGPAAITPYSKRWYRHGLLHNNKGPAIVDINEKSWYKNGIRHRIDGPAISCRKKLQNIWIINDTNITDKVRKWLKLHNNPKIPLNKNYQLLFKLTFL